MLTGQGDSFFGIGGGGGGNGPVVFQRRLNGCLPHRNSLWEVFLLSFEIQELMFLPLVSLLQDFRINNFLLLSPSWRFVSFWERARRQSSAAKCARIQSAGSQKESGRVSEGIQWGKMDTL